MCVDVYVPELHMCACLCCVCVRVLCVCVTLLVRVCVCVCVCVLCVCVCACVSVETILQLECSPETCPFLLTPPYIPIFIPQDSHHTFPKALPYIHAPVPLCTLLLVSI